MSKSPPTFIGIADPFWDAYNEAIEALADIGMKFPKRHRLSIFKLYVKINKEDRTWDEEIALWKLDVLRDVISQGLEPAHKNGQYV